MSSRSIYLRDQAAKCEWHADNIADVGTQKELRELAEQYIMQAAKIEAKEVSVPSLWFNGRIINKPRSRNLLHEPAAEPVSFEEFPVDKAPGLDLA